MTTLNLKPGDIYDLPDGRFRFLEEWDDETLWFIKKTGARLPLSETQLVDMLGAGEARKIDIFKRSDGRPKSVNDLGEFGPGEEFSPEAIRARTLQFFVRKWDGAKGPSLGRKGLKDFIDSFRHDDRLKLLNHNVDSTALYNAIVNCGEPGNRPLRAFRSLRGKTERKHFIKIVEDALDESVDFYWSLRTRTYLDAHGYFRDLMEKAGVDPQMFPRRMETLRRRINRTINQENWSRKYSPREATLKFEGIKDSLSAKEPLELVIMDHTVVDTFVVFDNEFFLPLGRPTLTVAIDVATRMILGYLVSFEPASLYSVLTTLKRVNRNKNYMAKLFGDIKGTWDAWGLPKTLLVDSGWEFKSASLQDALRDLGTEIIWSPVRTPQYKAVGERFFKTLNDRLFHKLPGNVPTGPTGMRLIDVTPREDAVISLGSLDELIHEAIVGYHDEFHSGIDDIPAQVWKRRLKSRDVISDINALDHLLGRMSRVRLTRRGIKFKNMHFHDQQKTSKLLDDMSRNAKRRDQSKSPVGSARCWVTIKWDPIDASGIQVWNDGAKPPRFVTLPNRDRQFVMMPPGAHRQRDAKSEFTRPISFWNAEKVRIFAKEKGLPFETDKEKWLARNKLRAKWERIAGILPMRDTKEAIRGLAQSQGTFDNPAGSPGADDAPVSASDVLFATAEPSVNGYGAATLVPQQIAAFEREDDERRARGKPPTEKAKAKRRRTRREKKESEADARAEAATENAKERARKAASQKEDNRSGDATNDANPKQGPKPKKKAAEPKKGDPDINLDKFLDDE
jgi:putative transposase